MAEPATKTILQKPPGYRDPSMPGQPVKPAIRRPVLPPSFRPKKTKRSYCRCCCCVCCIVFLILIFVLIIMAGLIYFVYTPRLPVFHLQSFRLPQLNVTDKSDGEYLNAHTMARVEVKNPSGRMAWYFKDTSFKISANNGDVSLGSQTIPAFLLKENEVRSLKVETSVKGTLLDNGQGKTLKGKLQRKEFVPNVEVSTEAGVGLEGFKIGTVKIDVECGNVSLNGLENGQMPQCTITLLKWVKIK